MSSSAQRFQAAQASASALLADNTLEWMLAQPNVADTVRDLLSTDSARLEAREHITTPRHSSATNDFRDDVAPHATNWTARAAEIAAAREPLQQVNGTSAQVVTGLPSRVDARDYTTTTHRPSAAKYFRDDVAPHATDWTARAAEVRAARAPLQHVNGTSPQEKTGSSSQAAVIEPAAIGPAINAPSTASAISKDSAAASMRFRRLDEGSGDAQCPATTSHLQATSEHAQLDFTGGYRNNDHCEWDVQCDQAVALHFTAMDTESNFDFVSLYDGGDENAPRLAHLSGHETSAGTFAAAAGEILVVFTSDSSNVADGFEAEYWCVSRESVGCTESSALNYSPAATVDDGSCRCGDDHCGDTTALLQAFVVDPTAQRAWDALHGWSLGSTNLCDWEGIGCVNDRVNQLNFANKNVLMFELTDSIAMLTKLRTL